MAKIKISELAKELSVDGKEVLSYLQEQGVDSAKRSTSSVDDAEADKIRKHFGKTLSGNSNNKETVKEIAKESAKKAVKEVNTNNNEEIKMEKDNLQQGNPVKKKKKIIIVTGQKDGNSASSQGQNHKNNASKSSGGASKESGNATDHAGKNKTSGRGNNKGGKNNSFSSAAAVYHPIKPKTAPSQREYESNIRKIEEPKPRTAVAPAENTQAKKAENVPAKKIENVSAETAPVQETKKETVLSKQDRNEKSNSSQKNNGQGHRQEKNNRAENSSRNGNREGRANSDRNNGERRQNSEERRSNRPPKDRDQHFDKNSNQNGRRGGDKSFNKGGQNGNGKNFGSGRSQGGRGNAAASFVAPAPSDKPVNNKHNDRRIDKDKRSKKDYEADEELMPRSKRVGRFIKPEVKKEVEPEEQIKVITIPEHLTIRDLADKMKMQPSAIIKKLFLAGQIVTVNSDLTYEEAENIAIDYDIICEKEVEVDVIEELLKEEDEDPTTLSSRPPVVCVMGHVDHGKTSLLDKIRDTSVTEREAGGITQRIGAYTISVDGKKVTFLDTPGHEAFTAMRMRGANSTDIAVLVVAADDGVMPQTIEAINHAKAANVEIIVAVNKIDKPSANIDRVKQELTEYGLISTDWGGTTEFVPVSAKTGEGIDTLLETIILTSDILELKANPNRMARGIVLEAKLDKGRGPVANVLVQKGTLHVGDFVSAGASHGRVRAMSDDKGRRVKEATPSTPVEILGLSDVPNAGEVIVAHSSDKDAKHYADTYLQQHKKDLIEETKAKMSLDDLYSKIEEGKLKELDIILKADVQGSVEALKASLMKLSNEEVVVKIIHGGVGAINESDVTLAAASNAIIIGFDVRPDATAKSMADHEGVEIKLYKVIYQAIDDVEAALKGMLAPVYEEKVIGHAEVRQIFKASAIGNIAGCFVKDGMMQRGCRVRINRNDEQVFEGDLKSLKRFKDDVKEVKEGYECGLVFDDFDQMNVGDMVEAYVMVEVPRN